MIPPRGPPMVGALELLLLGLLLAVLAGVILAVRARTRRRDRARAAETGAAVERLRNELDRQRGRGCPVDPGRAAREDRPG